MARSLKKRNTLRKKRGYVKKSHKRRPTKNNSRKIRRKQSKKTRRRRRRNMHKKQRGGFRNNVFLSRPQQFPPGGPLAVPKPGIQTVNDSKYYYAKNNRVQQPPNMGTPVLKRGGGRKQKGGSLSSALGSAITAFPGGTDIRDAYWSSTNKLSNLWNNWNGFPGTMSPSPSVQPIGQTKISNLVKEPDIAKIYADAGKTASSKPYQAYN